MPSPSFKDPSTLFYQSSTIKRSVIASYWIVILFSIPLWWYTTSIQRLTLPRSRIDFHAQRQLRVPVDICIEDNNVAHTIQNIFEQRIVDNPGYLGDVGLRFHVRVDCPGTPFYYIRNNPRTYVRENQVHLSLDDPHRLSSTLDTLARLISPYQQLSEYGNRVVQFSPQFRLSFTLLNEDAAMGNSVSDWNIQAGLAYRINPILDRLRLLHNFTIESQVQFHGRLAFNPQPIGNRAYGLTPEDLTIFINSAEWSLSSIASSDPVIHFVLFIPSPARRPLHILTSDGDISPSKSFILPQWGGIIVYNPPIDETGGNNDLSPQINDHIFHEFSQQLLLLLGVPSLPNGIEHHPSNLSILSTWQVDALMRHRAIENTKGAQETLTSILKLVDQIENMPVKNDVKDDVEQALDALERVFSAESLQDTFRNSAEAMTLASRAFFNPGMLALLYFPAEHKYAVYTPLFASAVIPLFVAALKEIRSWRRERKEKQRAAFEETQEPLVVN